MTLPAYPKASKIHTPNLLHLSMRLLIALFLLGIGQPGRAQPQPDHSGLRISLLTCSPGAELYSTFGHSALRIIDSSAGTDIVYNFGVFNFSDPDFYLHFVRGKLLYFLDQESFTYFQYAYVVEGRGITEQVLRLHPGRDKKMQSFLAENLRPENRFYKYDFLYDNCTTRLRDLILGQEATSIHTSPILEDSSQTFRNQLHVYLDKNQQHWSALGIDILLGSRIDQPMTNAQAMFLPDFLEKAIDSSKDASGTIVSEKKVILDRQISAATAPTRSSPTLWAFSAILACMVLLSMSRQQWAQRCLSVADFFLFFTTGLLGLLLVFMWTGTDHASCRDNLNLAWALPSHLIAAFRRSSHTKLVRGYFQSVFLLSILIAVGWNFLPQQLNSALFPLVLWQGWRAYRLMQPIP